MASSKKVRKFHEIIFMSYEFQDDLNSDLYKTITMLSISRILESSNVDESIGGFLSLYALMNPSILETEEYVSEIINDSILLKKVEIRNKEDFSKYINYSDEESNEFVSKHLKLNVKNIQQETLIFIRPMSQIFKERFNSLNFKASSIVAYIGLCLILLSKKLDKYNYHSWIKNKWNSFLRTVGVNKTCSDFGPSEVLFPRLKICKDIYTFFSKHKSLRRALFVGIMKLSTENGIWSNVCRTVLKLSKGVEMNHICLINTYILQDHPEIITMTELKNELLQLQSAFKVFENSCLPKEQWPYLKILFFSLKAEFDKKNFPILTDIAIQIGMKTQPSLLHFTTSTTPEKSSLTKKVLNFIYKENSLVCYNKLKSRGKITGKVAIEKNSKNLSEFAELLNLSDSFEQSLHQSLGIHSFHDKDISIKCFPNVLPTTKITYMKLSEKAEGQVFQLVSLLSIVKVYENNCIEHVIGGILTLIANTKFDLSSDDYKVAFKNHGYELVEILIESTAEVALYFEFEDEVMDLKLLNYCGALNKPRSKHCQKIIKTSPEFKKLFEHNIEIHLSTVFILIGLYLMFIFKQLNEDNYSEWVNHKIDTFIRVLSKLFQDSYEVNTNNEFLNSSVPTLETSQAIYSFFSTNFQLRKLMFLRIWNITDSNHILSWICLVIGQIAKATEMNHIFLINKFIIKENTVLMKMKELRPELKRYLSVLENIQNKAIEEKYWPFLKIILHPADTEFLNKNNFPLLTFLAGKNNNSNEVKKYKGGKLSTSYIQQVTQITSDFDKTFLDEFRDEKDFYLNLNLQIGDLLSTINDEQLKNLYVNSELMYLSLIGIFCCDEKEEEIRILKNLTVDKAKKKLANRINPISTISILNRLLKELYG